MEETEKKVPKIQKMTSNHMQGVSNSISKDHVLSLASLELFEVPKALITVELEILQELFLDYNNLEALPADILSNMVCLKKLSVIGNNLTALPENIDKLCSLQEMYLNENEIDFFPERLTQLKTLKVINVVGNKLQNLPAEIGQLESLEQLCADENELDALPDTLGLLKKLTVLEVCSNKITCLPRSFGQLQSLEVLNVSNNNIEKLPTSFCNLPHVFDLDLSRNKLKTLPSTFASCKVLKKFYAESNEIALLPEWIGNLPEILEFSLKDNKLQDSPISKSFGEVCQKLKHFDMGGNFITHIPESLGHLKKLEYVDFGSVIDELERRNFQNGNWLYSLPMSFGELTSLKELHLEENQLHELPDNFGCLVNLESVDFGQNLLHELPESFGDLASLRVCLLSKNHLELLPSGFGKLSSLEDLRLDNNQLAELPESFDKLTQLKTLDLFNNRLTQIPEALHNLTNLVRLDIDENQFDLDPLEVPHVSFSAKYAPRDPDLKDNWRGRPRQDLSQVEVTKLELDQSEDPEPEENAQQYSFNMLERAVRRNLSIWSSHNGPSKREVWNPSIVHRRTKQATEDEIWEDQEKDEPEENEKEDWDEDLSDAKRCQSTDGRVSSPEPENWDEDLEDSTPYSITPVYRHPTSAGYVPSSEELNHFFVPSNCHVYNQRRKYEEETVICEAGQFDDLDDEEDES